MGTDSTLGVLSGITCERSTDYDLIRSIITHPRVYPHVSDDLAPPASEWQPVQSDAAIYLVMSDEERTLGLFAFFPENSILVKVHTCLLPVAYGERAKSAALAAMCWIWNTTRFLRIITDVPAYNRLAFCFAVEAGMSKYGVNPSSYLKNGKLWDVELLGVSKCQ